MSVELSPESDDSAEPSQEAREKSFPASRAPSAEAKSPSGAPGDTAGQTREEKVRRPAHEAC